MTGVLDQDNQCFESLRSQRYGLALEGQKTFAHVEEKGAERIEMLCFLAHKSRQKFFKISSQFRKDFETVTELRYSASEDGRGLGSRPRTILVRVRGRCKIETRPPRS